MLNKTSAVKDWLKKTAIRVGEAILITTVAEKVAPTAKHFGGKVLDKLSTLQGRKNVEELDELAKRSEEKAPASSAPETPATVVPPTIVPPPAIKTDVDTSSGIVEAKFG